MPEDSYESCGLSNAVAPDNWEDFDIGEKIDWIDDHFGLNG